MLADLLRLLHCCLHHHHPRDPDHDSHRLLSLITNLSHAHQFRILRYRRCFSVVSFVVVVLTGLLMVGEGREIERMLHAPAQSPQSLAPEDGPPSQRHPKRKASTQDNERLSKRLSLLNIGILRFQSALMSVGDTC